MGVLFLTCLASALFLAEASAPGSSCISDYNNCTGSYYCVDNKSAPEINCSGNVSTFTPHPLPPPPPPGDCVLSDGVCMFVNMCMIWVNNQSEYQCTLDSEHNNTHITNVNTTLLPPGECIYQSGQCNWSKCFSWLDLCQMRWRCHSQYYYKRKPHPICPVRPIAPPPIPGVCRYNPRVGHCRFHRPSELTCTLSYDDCTGGYFCDPGIPDSGNCSIKIPQNIAPPPSICTENSIGCTFYNPCKAWNKGCYGAVPQCTLESEYIQYNKSNPPCHLYTPAPPPKEECLYIDYKCQWYNECAMWLSDTGYQCGTTIDKYIYTHSLTPVKNNGSSVALPPGECINQLGTCTWSMCRSWLNWCNEVWMCGSQYDYEAYFNSPPPPCPPPPQNFTPPNEPGVCQFDLASGHCQYYHPLSELTCTLTYDDCTGEYFCDPGIPNPGNCSVKVPQNIAPPPSICRADPFGCVFYNPCKGWNKGCFGAVPQCTLESEYIQYNNTHPHCNTPVPMPPPKEECLYIDFKCQWYNECAMWLSDTGYQCGTAIDKYIYTHSLIDNSINTTNVLLPPGECINQLGNCTWSICRSWLDWCQFYWMCGSQYDHDVYFASSPPPPCPPPPQNYTPPAEPGVCQYNLTSGHCHYHRTEFNCSLTYDKCAGDYSCSSAHVSNPVSCSVPIPREIAPPPDICTENSSGCEYYNPCKAWNKGCLRTNPQCTLESEYIEYNKSNPCNSYNSNIPPPKEECLYIDYKCQWYNECAMWLSDTGYQCGTAIDKCIYTHSLSLIKKGSNNNNNGLSLPPGECINQLGACTWSMCRSWLDWCQGYWLCGSQYDYDAYFTTPPPPCPKPPPNYTPPPESGLCQYNLISNKCQYFHSLTELTCTLTYDACTGGYFCAPGIPDSGNCSVKIPQDIAPPPDICTEDQFGCLYYNPCKSWNKGCHQNDPQCTLESEYIKYNKSNPPCPPYHPAPPPKEECLYIDNKCQWYNECAMWLSDTGYQCGTAIDKYIYTHSLSLIDNNGSSVVLPPGECINQLGTCTWSVCRSWMDWCKTRWMCGSQYDYDAYFTTPPPPCPLPPPPPPEPGVCQYDLSLGHCQYRPTEFNCSLTYDKCTGDYSCSSARVSNPVSCSVPIPREIAPPPNICTENSFGCEYYNPCKAWNKGCFGVDYQCTLESVYVEYNKTHQECVPFNSLPPPKEECLYIDYKCQWYNECAMWLSDTGYQCGTAIDKYIYTHSLTPVENNRSSVALPPGECINQLGTCTWSMCRSFLDWCQGYWLCGSQYDYEAYFTTPPPLNCPSPPHNPPIEPGVCQYNFTTSHCQYNHNSIDPCDVVLCPVGSTCQVYGSTSYCKYSCQIANGGCSSNQTCSLVPVQCITAPCYPVVKCTDANVTTYKPANDFITNYILMGIAILTSLVTLAMLCAVIAVKQYRLRKKALVEQEMKLICDADTTDI